LYRDKRDVQINTITTEYFITVIYHHEQMLKSRKINDSFYNTFIAC